MPNYNDSDLSKGFIHEENTEEAEDRLEVYREVLGSSEDDEVDDSNVPKVKSDYIPINLEGPPKETWADKEDLKFKIGELVVYRAEKRGQSAIYKVVGPDIDPGTWKIKKSGERDPIVEFEYKLKRAPKKANWERYESNPYLLWKREQEKKNKEAQEKKK